MLRKFATFITSLSFLWSNLLYGADIKTTLADKMPQVDKAPASEYSMQNFRGESQIKVRMLGAVQRPGLYHVPAKSDLLTLVTLAGGLSPSADDSKVYLSREADTKEPAKVISLSELVKSGDTRGPAIYSNDLIYVNPKQPLWNPDVLATIGAVSGVLAIVLTGFLLTRRVND